MYLITEWAARHPSPGDILETLRDILDAVEHGEVKGSMNGSWWRLGPEQDLSPEFNRDNGA